MAQQKRLRIEVGLTHKVRQLALEIRIGRPAADVFGLLVPIMKELAVWQQSRCMIFNNSFIITLAKGMDSSEDVRSLVEKIPYTAATALGYDYETETDIVFDEASVGLPTVFEYIDTLSRQEHDFEETLPRFEPGEPKRRHLRAL
ncbi:MAG: hypothetical protein WAQ27_06480 [Candidatus Microsaccharimonas sp.]